jgi:hypothetical protein
LPGRFLGTINTYMDILENMEFTQETLDAVEGLLAMGPLTPMPATTPTDCPWAPTKINNYTQLEIEESEDEDAERQAHHAHYLKEMTNELDPWTDYKKPKATYVNMGKSAMPLMMANGQTFPAWIKDIDRHRKEYYEARAAEGPAEPHMEQWVCDNCKNAVEYMVEKEEDGVEHITILN